MAERGLLIGIIEAFLCQQERNEKQLDRWECHHLVSAISYIDTPMNAQLGITVFNKVRVPVGARLPPEVDEIPKTDPLLTLTEARACFEEAISRPLREL